MTTPDVPLLSFVYASTATTPFDDAALASLLKTSRRNNAADDLTGTLLYREGRFLQVLEGPGESVLRRMAVIGGDPRHTNVRVLIEEAIPERWFPEWTMGYQPVSAEQESSIPGYRSTFDDLELGDDVQGGTVMRALPALIDWFRSRAATGAR